MISDMYLLATMPTSAYHCYNWFYITENARAQNEDSNV